MPSKKISQLPTSVALDGTEQVPVVQSGETRTTTTQDIANLLVTSYSSYVAIVSFQLSGFTETILQNDFTSVTFTWSNPTTNVLRVTPSVGTTFTLDKTVVFVNSYDNDYLVTPTRTGGSSSGVVNLTHKKWDGTTNSLSYGTFFIEIRVYP
jgi:hypothetical protein